MSMYDNIIDIYDLSNLKVDLDYMTIKFIFELGQLVGLEIDDEPYNIKKISHRFNTYKYFFDLYPILDEYGYNS